MHTAVVSAAAAAAAAASAADISSLWTLLWSGGFRRPLRLDLLFFPPSVSGPSKTQVLVINAAACLVYTEYRACVGI